MSKEVFHDEVWHSTELRKELEDRGISSYEELKSVICGMGMIKNIKADVLKIQQEIKNLYPAFYAMCERKSAEKNKDTGYHNPMGTALHFLIADIENVCLTAMVKELHDRKVIQKKGKNIGSCSLMFDGLMVLLSAVDDLEGLLRGMEAAAYRATSKNGAGIRIQLVAKPMDEYFDDFTYEEDDASDGDSERMDTDEDGDNGSDGDADEGSESGGGIVVETDLDAATYFLDQHYGKDVVMSDGILLVRGSNGGWMIKLSGRDSKASRFLNGMIMKEPILLMGPKGVPVPYTAKASGMRNVAAALDGLMCHRDDPEFIKRIWYKSKHLLVFEDGYFDFTRGERGEFVEGFEDANGEVIDFVHMIRRKFPRQSNPEVRRRLMERLIDPVFENCDFVDELFQEVARALGGHVEDKLTVILKSGRNSGKSVIMTLVTNAFGPYAPDITAENLMLKQGCGSAELDNNWLMYLEFARLGCLMELKTDSKHPADGKKWKDVQGNDQLRGRGLFGDPRSFKIQATLFIGCNGLPKVNPADALQECLVFPFPNEFKPAAQYDKIEGVQFSRRIKKRDQSIHSFIQESKVIDEFILCVLEHYQRDRVVPTSEMIEAHEAILADAGKAKFDELFEVTGREQDFVPQPIITQITKQHRDELQINNNGEFEDILTRKLREMYPRGIPFTSEKVLAQRTVNGRRVYVYLGVKQVQGMDINPSEAGASGYSAGFAP